MHSCIIEYTTESLTFRTGQRIVSVLTYTRVTSLFYCFLVRFDHGLVYTVKDNDISIDVM